MAKFSPNVLRALKEVYSESQLLAERDRLAAEVLSGVAITSLGMDNANGSGQLTAEPAELLDMVQTLLDQYDEADTSSSSSPMVDFSHMTFGT